MSRGFSPKQQRFIDFYNGNATEAALKAGYSQRTAASIGQENLKKPEIWDAIQKREQNRNSKDIATREQRQKFWTDVMNDANESMQNRLRAAELLGKSEADFVEKRQNENTGKIVLEWATSKNE